MKLTFINGSPRGEKSNTKRLMDHFLLGFEEDGNNYEIVYLAKNRKKREKSVEAFETAESVIVGFPLYVDSMPGTVKEFFEDLRPFMGRENNPSLGFMVQCGFPETHHNRFLERYLEKFANRMNCHYTGSILKGGCEGLDIQPPFLTEKYFRYFYELGKAYGETGEFDEVLLDKLARPEHLTVENLRQVIPFINKALWDSQLEKNGVIDKSFNKPYVSE